MKIRNSRVYAVRREKRLEKLEEMVLSGTSNRSKMAAALGVTKLVIDSDLVLLENRLREHQRRQRPAKRAEAAAVYRMLQAKALEDYELSRSAVIMCEQCGGLGYKEQDDGAKTDCVNCDGQGQELVRVPGDVKYLKLALDARARIDKIEGLEPTAIQVKQTKNVQQNFIGGPHARGDVNPLLNAPPELLLDAMRVIAAVDRLAEPEGRTIDAEVNDG